MVSIQTSHDEVKKDKNQPVVYCMPPESRSYVRRRCHGRRGARPDLAYHGDDTLCTGRKEIEDLERAIVI